MERARHESSTARAASSAPTVQRAGVTSGMGMAARLRGIGSYREQVAALAPEAPVQLKPDPGGRKPKGDGAGAGEAAQDARLDALVAEMASLKKDEAATGAHVSELEKTVGEQGARIDALEQGGKEKDAEIATLKAQNEAQSLVESSLAQMLAFENNQQKAIDQLKLEIVTAPASIADDVKEALKALVNIVFGFCSGLLDTGIERGLGAANKALIASFKSGTKAIASASVSEGLAAALAKPDDPGAFFLGVSQAARCQQAAFLFHVNAVAGLVSKVDEPVAMAKALNETVSAMANGIYQQQYDATFGAYYQIIAAKDAAKRGREDHPMQPGAGPVDMAERGQDVDGVLVIEAVTDDHGVKVTGADFDGAKTEGHMDYLRKTPVGRLRVPIRLEIDTEKEHATLFRDAAGDVRPTGDTLWLARRAAEHSAVDLMHANHLIRAEAEAIFRSMDSVALTSNLE